LKARARISIRLLMIAVAAVGLTLGLKIEANRRSALYSNYFFDHHRCSSVHTFGPVEQAPRVRAYCDYHMQLAEKYEWASRYPLFPVQPDPPAPPWPWGPLNRRTLGGVWLSLAVFAT